MKPERSGALNGNPGLWPAREHKVPAARPAVTQKGQLPMTKTARILSATASFAVLAAVSIDTARAQETAPVVGPADVPAESPSPPGATAAQQAPETTIVVTGSRIRKDVFSAAEPLTVITGRSITQSGFASTAEALQSTAVTAGASQINNAYGGYVTDGGTGANTLSLRGLGPTRTLVLLNGRRLAPAGTRGAVGAADLNVLPSAIIDRVELLKAGASSIYGSDAVAGVVNIITARRPEGLRLDAQADVPGEGAGSSYRLSGVYGYNSDRFHLAMSLDYYQRDALLKSDRAFTRCAIDGFITGPGAALGSGDFIDPATGQPKCYPLDAGGVTINTLGVSTRAATPAAGTTGTLFNRLRPNPTAGGGVPGYEGVSLDSRTSFDPAMLGEELITPAKVYTGFLQSSYETGLPGDAELYVELLANRRTSSAKLYRQLSLDYPVGSPLIPAQFQDSDLGITSDTTNGQDVGARAFVGYGLLDSQQRVDYIKAAGGLRGNVPSVGDWRYDLYFSNSWTDARYSTESFLTSRLIAATNGIVANANGTFSCAPGAPAGCVAAPYLTPAVIGGQLPQNFRNYIVQNVTGTTKFREFTAALNVDGSLFRLPGGTAKLALGAEYRRSRIDDTPPAESIAGDLLNLSAALPTRGSDAVWEVFGEAYFPLLSDTPFFYRLNTTASVRQTHYRSYGSNRTYKVAAEWEPFRGLAFRGSYGTSYRAPALFEQFLGATSGFQSQQLDPCNDYGESPNANLRANCASLGLPGDFQATSGIVVLSGGGASSGLKPETSRNFTYGVVLKPQLPSSIGSASLSLDYFDIKVNNGVSQVGETNILDRCYSSPSDFAAGTGFCRLITRDKLDDNKLTVNNNYVNTATEKVRGLEFNFRLTHDFGPNVEFEASGLVTHYLEQSTQLFADEAPTDYNGIIGTPDWTGSFDASLTFAKKFTISYGLDWIGPDHSRTYAYFEEDPANSQFYLAVPSYFLHRISFNLDVNDRFSIGGGVRNLFDRDPPRVSTTFDQVYNLVGNAPLYSGYDYVGRTFFLNVGTKF